MQDFTRNIFALSHLIIFLNIAIYSEVFGQVHDILLFLDFVTHQAWVTADVTIFMPVEEASSPKDPVSVCFVFTLFSIIWPLHCVRDVPFCKDLLDEFDVLFAISYDIYLILG